MLRQVVPDTAESESTWRRVSAWGVPWLLSSTVHLVLLLTMAVTFTWKTERGAADWANLTSGISLTSVHVGPTSDAEAEDGVELSPSGVPYFSDESETPTESTAASAAATSATAAAAEAVATDSSSAAMPSTTGALAAVLSDKPLVSLSGMLPEASAGLGKGALEGGRVGNATGMTKGPKGDNQLRRGYASTGIFGVVGQGHKFAYVFDRSGSMDGHGGAPLAAAKRELIASLDDLGQTHQFQIIFYNEHPRIFNLSGSPGKLVFGNDQNKMLARKFVGGITADGGTQHEEALAMALRMAPDVIFFLTDADEPQLSAAQLQKIARLNKGSSINTVEFGFGPQQSSDNFLVRLASQNGGQHVYIDVSQLPRVR